MKILVFSDSHSSLRFMYRCVEAFKPDAIVHLGDHYDDGETLAEKYPQYGFAKHKGYGTKAHYEAIRLHGVCAEHRISFLKNVL